ncbi:putative nucleotide-diphospho-sugar transferase [Lutispora thermophila]|nr:putative nucleotide-diphospho-sugar transferase [Lutispora thermophila]
MKIRTEIMDIALCTIISKLRIHQFLALYESIIKNRMAAHLFVFCVDRESYDLLKKMGISKAVIIDFSKLEDKTLINLRKERKIYEYCWTIKPVVIEYIFKKHSKIKKILYVDSDIYFFSDPLSIINRIKKWSVIVTTHRSSKNINGGFVCFKRDKIGLEALKWWKRQCFNWCYDYFDNGNFGDQGHLDRLKKHYRNIYYLEHPGFNVASWNEHLYQIKTYDDRVYVDNVRMVFYHFSGLRMINKTDYIMLWQFEPKGYVYGHYINVLRKKIEEIENVSPGFTDNIFK